MVVTNPMCLPPPLPFRIQPNPLESGRGFLLRVSNELGLGRVSVISHLTGADFNSLNNEEALRRLAHWFRLPDVGLMRKHFYASVVPGKRDGQRYFLDTQVLSKYLSKYSSKVCPHCLLDQPFHRAIWDITFVVACPFHRCLLLDRCPCCQKALSAKRRGPHLCSCGHDLRRSMVEAADEQTLRITELIYSAANNWNGATGSNGNYPSQLANLDLNGILNVIQCLSSRLYAPAEKRQQVALRGQLDMSTWVRCMHFVDNLLSAWPIEFHNLLAEIHKEYQAPLEQRKVKDAFSRLYRHLITYDSLDELGFLRNAFREYLADHWDGLPKWHNRWLRGEAAPSNKWMTVAEASEQSKDAVKPKIFRRLIQNGTLRGKFSGSEGRSKCRQLWIERSSFQSWIQNSGQWVSLNVAAGMLGISWKGVSELIRVKALTTSFEDLPGCRPGVKVFKNDVENVVAAFEEYDLHPTDKAVLAHDSVSLCDAVHDYIGIQGLPNVVSSVRSGSLRPSAILTGCEGIYRYCFNKSELIKQCRPIEGRNVLTLSNNEVKKCLHVGSAIVTALTRAGFLPSYGMHGKEMLYDAEVVDNFHRQYISSREIARVTGTSASKVLRVLSPLSPDAIQVMDAEGKRVVFWPRETVETGLVSFRNGGTLNREPD